MRPAAAVRAARTVASWLAAGVLLALAPGVAGLPGLPGITGATGATGAAHAAPPAPPEPPEPPPPVTSAEAKKQVAAVDIEDIRLRSMFGRFGLLDEPEKVETQGSLPTLLLPSRARPYTVADVVAADGMRREVDGATLVTMHILVGPGARLVVGAEAGQLRLASGPGGFASLVTWRGAIEVVGAGPAQPLAVTSWNVGERRPDEVALDGRAYLRTMGGELVLRHVRASGLGFWTGRTGGVAWSGKKGEPSTGGAAGSAFVANTYGAYVSGSEGVQLVDSRFEGNERAGLAVQRDALGTVVSQVTSTRNHGDGVNIDRASGSRVMRSTFTDNGGDGITLDGRGLGVVGTASGPQVNQVKGAVIEENTVGGNGRHGIQVLGGEDTHITGNKVVGAEVGIIVKSGANGTRVTGNAVSGAAGAGIQVGPGVRRTAIVGNDVDGSRLGIVVQDSPVTIVSRNEVRGASEFAVTVRGPADETAIGYNTLSGHGWRPIDTRQATGVGLVGDNETDGWVFRESSPWYDLVREHPALLVWGVMVILPGFGWWHGRRMRRRPAGHPYPESDLLVRRLTGATRRPLPGFPGVPGVPGVPADLAYPSHRPNGVDLRNGQRWIDHGLAPPQASQAAQAAQAAQTTADMAQLGVRDGSRPVLQPAGDPGPLSGAPHNPAALGQVAALGRATAPGRAAALRRLAWWPEHPATDIGVRPWWVERSSPGAVAAEDRRPAVRDADDRTVAVPVAARSRATIFFSMVAARRASRSTSRNLLLTALTLMLSLTIAACTADGPAEQDGTGGAGARPAGTQAAVPAPAASGQPVLCPPPTVTVAGADDLRSALSSARPGTVIHLADGVYPGGFQLTASGTDAAPIWVCGSRNAVVDGQDDTDYLFHVEGAAHVRLVGFSLRDGKKGVMADGMRHGVIASLSVGAVGDEAIHLRSHSTDNLVVGNVVRDTGNRREKFGEGVYIGSAAGNWCKHSGCGPDRSDRNSVVGNDIADVTSEAVDVKEGTTGGVVSGNLLSAASLVDADSLIDVKGNGWVVEYNVGTGGGALEDGIQVHVEGDDWGKENIIRLNRIAVDAPGYGVYIHKKDRGNVVGCDNEVTGAAKGLANVPCTPP